MLKFKKETGAAYQARLRAEYETKIDPKLRLALDFLGPWVEKTFGKDLVVTCLIRTQAENYAVNGKPASAHLTGRAADLRTAGVFTAKEVQQIIEQIKVMWGDVICCAYHDAGTGQHLHININRQYATAAPQREREV